MVVEGQCKAGREGRHVGVDPMPSFGFKGLGTLGGSFYNVH